ncbi:MAG: Holliday junction resolvase RecU [Eubacterium sp.]|nr:Holliday junction resolvase RecU [Eubacterium sp.]
MYRNSEGYADPTAGAALGNIRREERRKKKLDRHIQGRRSRAFGEIFETRIGHALDRYADLDVACIQKTPEPFRVIRNIGNGRFEGFYEKKGQPDFKGCLCDGTAIVFEAKHTDSDRIQQSVVTDMQTFYFNKYEKLGARCYVMVSLGLSTFYRVPWDVWKGMKEKFGHKYMNADDLQLYKLKETNGFIQLLEGIELKGEDNEDTES